jgi:hypothetical protein
VVQVEEYMQLAELWRAKAVIALADEVLNNVKANSFLF